MRLAVFVGQLQRLGLVALQHRCRHCLLLGAGLGRRHRADHQGRRGLATGQGILQTVEQLADAEVVDRQDQPARRRSHANPGTTHQPVEHPATAFEHLGDGRLAPVGGGQVGDHLGVAAIDTDYLMPRRTQGGTDRRANARGTATDSCNRHSESP